ncbi:MAG TPA: hypothetical protein VGK51_16770 [Actinomycetota bacterium]|jgi:hypothetical protein
MGNTKTSRGRVRPSVTGRAGQTRPPAAPRGRSPWRLFVYAFVFACLVALSLVLRSSNQPAKTTTSGSSSDAVHPSLPGITSSAPAAGGPIVDSDFAKASCGRPDVQQSGFTLIAAFETTAGTAAAWEDALSQGSVTSPLHELPPGMKVAVCYLDGPWQAPQNVADLYRQEGVVPDRGIRFVPQAGAVVDGPIAPHTSLPILRPAAPPASPHP